MWPKPLTREAKVTEARGVTQVLGKLRVRLASGLRSTTSHFQTPKYRPFLEVRASLNSGLFSFRITKQTL